MNWFERLSLRKLLTVPYVLLILLLASVIAWLSNLSGRNAVDNLSGQLLHETVTRIGLAATQHISGAQAVLEAAFPAGMPAPDYFDAPGLEAMRTRFWVATSIHREPNNYAYYGDEHGRFFGLLRSSEQDAEIRLRVVNWGVRSIRRFQGIHGTPDTPTYEETVYEPRERPWFKEATLGDKHRWTPIYIDFKTKALVTTRVRRVVDAQGDFAGAVATDLPLKRIDTFLNQLELSPNAIALIVEADGAIVGASRGNTTALDAKGNATRMYATQSNEALVAATYAAVQARISQWGNMEPHTTVIDDAHGQPVQVGYSKLQDDAGLDWWIMVAVPRSDFLADIDKNFLRSIWLTAAAALAAVLIGLTVLSTVTRELSKLAAAAKRVGDGQLSQPLLSHRKDELGDLARTFSEMQDRLLTDQLTGLQNREAVLRSIEERIAQRRRRNDPTAFAVLFADFNRFKQINDRFGHAVGDQVLRELAGRLRQNVRAHDMVARYAGDEFVLVIDEISHASDAHAVRATLEEALSAPLEALQSLAPDEPADGAAFGLAIFPQDGQDVQTLINHADDDMYRRKSNG